MGIVNGAMATCDICKDRMFFEIDPMHSARDCPERWGVLEVHTKEGDRHFRKCTTMCPDCVNKCINGEEHNPLAHPESYLDDAIAIANDMTMAQRRELLKHLEKLIEGNRVGL